jgi:sugar/nucleoside kinase (ribokinase family)
MSWDVCGIGNALLDALVLVDDDGVLHRHGLKRGTMHLVQDARWQAVFEEVRAGGVELQPGGSCANAVSTVSLLGGRATYCGVVGDDVHGQQYLHGIQSVMGEVFVSVREGAASGKCLSLVSRRDAERTMLTDLAIAMDLSEPELPVEAIETARWLHVTGYLLTGGRMVDAAFAALDRALRAGTRISFDVGDAFVIDHFRDRVQEVVRRYADLVFLNEEEARRLTGGDASQALHEVSRWADIAVVKLGARGSLIQHGDDVIPVEARRVAAVDTTGAGDAYAGGFLYGLTRGRSLQSCGRIASAVAALTVGQVGGVFRDRERLRDAIAQLGDDPGPRSALASVIDA